MSNVKTGAAVPVTSAKLRSLDRLIGEWDVAGGASGVVRYEWMDGGHFMLQRIALGHGDDTETGLEIIGHLQPFGASPSEHVHSRYYGSSGSTLDYVYELDGDELTIWAGDVNSPACYRGRFDITGDTLTGGWIYPGGGYRTVATRRVTRSA